MQRHKISLINSKLSQTIPKKKINNVLQAQGTRLNLIRNIAKFPLPIFISI